jgi:phosphoenolpyruvate-protein kinase (PTS system EI component)
MRKIIAVVTLMLAFTINANAQDKKTSTLSATSETNTDPQSAAKKDASEMAEYLKLSDTQVADFFRLFETKHKMLQDKSLSQDRRKEVSKSIDAKIRATLDANQIEILEKNPELFKKLIN